MFLVLGMPNGCCYDQSLTYNERHLKTMLSEMTKMVKQQQTTIDEMTETINTETRQRVDVSEQLVCMDVVVATFVWMCTFVAEM